MSTGNESATPPPCPGAEAAVETWTSYLQPRLNTVLSKVSAAQTVENPKVTLVAVSKIKPAAAVRACYYLGQRTFGENYAQEMVAKATDPLLQECVDIQWHMVGRLQSNKAAMLVKGVPKLTVVETVETEKLANKLNAAVNAAVSEGIRSADFPLGVMIQVNTSGEPQKGGVEPAAEEGSKLLELADHIVGKCPGLKLLGLMTIGMPDFTSRPENFECLVACRKRLAEHMNVEERSLRLSMGMSGDFEAALKMGSTDVRVGSSIFGPRPPK